MGKGGKERERIVGRAMGPRLVWKSALGPPGDKAVHSTVVSRSWSRIVEWCGTIRQAHKHAGARSDRLHPMAKAAQVAARRIRAAKKWKWKPGEEVDTLHRFVDEFRVAQEAGRESRIMELTAWAETEATNAARRAATDAAKRYREWIQSGPAKGLSRQHSASKRLGQWVAGKMVKEPVLEDESLAQVVATWEGGGDPSRLSEVLAITQLREGGGEVPANIQQEVDIEEERWAKEWAAGQMAEDCRWPESFEALPPIQAHHIREAAKTFADGCGLGWDRLHPKALLRLPESMLAELGRILGLAEREGSWQDAVGLVITALIPKTDGGRRPIGLLPAIVRVWARIRAVSTKEWERSNDRDYLYGGEGKGAQVAAWKYAARAEAARLDNVAYATVLLDLEKAFDRVPHHHLVVAARR